MFKDFIKTRLATWILGIVLAFAMLITARILVQQYQVNKEISKLQQQAERIKKDNEQLSSLIQYFNSENYAEKQAREKLNLKKDGEYVVSLPAAADEGSVASETKNPSNLEKWFNYFFDHAQ